MQLDQGGTLSVSKDLFVTGNSHVSGTKSAMVKTSLGDTLLYSQESPESWFEDFYDGRTTGRAITQISIDPLYLETVEGAFKVFVQGYGEYGYLHVTKDARSVYLESDVSIDFSIRVVAHRKGYEDIRLAVFETRG